MGKVKQFPVVGESLEDISRRVEVLEKCNRDDGGSGMVDERVAKLETIADFMREDLSGIKKEMQ